RALHGRLRQTQRRHLRKQLVRPFTDALARRPHERDEFLRGLRQTLRRQTHTFIPRRQAATTMAIVVRPLQRDRPENAQRPQRTVALKPRRLPTRRTRYAGPFVAVFFSRRRSSYALAPIFKTKSRTSNSVLPKRSLSSLPAKSRAKELTS